MGALLRFLRPQTKLFAVEFRRILEIFPFDVYKESSGRIITIFASKNGAVCREVQTQFESSPNSGFTKRFLGAFSPFLRPKTKLFAVKFRRIFEVLRIQGLQKDFWAHFHHFCVQKRRVCREIQTDFGRFARASFIKKVWVHFLDFCVLKRICFL